MTLDPRTLACRTFAGRTFAGRTFAGRTFAGRTFAGRTFAGRTFAGLALASLGVWTALPGSARAGTQRAPAAAALEDPGATSDLGPIQSSDPRVVFRAVSNRTRRLSDTRRAELRASTRRLVEACPYERVSADAVALLAAELGRLVGSRAAYGLASDADLRDAVLGVERALDALHELAREHLAVLADLGVPPAPPRADGTLVDEDPARAWAELQVVRDRVEALGPAERARLDAARKGLARHTGGHWNFKALTIGHRSDLEVAIGQCRAGLESFAASGTAAAPFDLEAKLRLALVQRRLEALRDVLNELIRLYC